MPRVVVLVGMMGSGKTTVGRRVAAKLGYKFIDTDDLVVARAGQSVREVFEYHRISKVPLACDVVRGVMNLRGNVITVVDLSARLYGKRKPDNGKGVVVIAEIEDSNFNAQVMEHCK